MKYITPRHMVAFNDELQKEAGRLGDVLQHVREVAKKFPARTLGRVSGEFSGRYGRQLGVGAGAGALGGALIADPDEPGSRLKGAVRGALVGGGLAGAGVLATRGGREAAKKGVGNFYQRQRYSITGRGLGDDAKSKLRKARDIGLVDRFDPKRFSDAKKRAAEKARIKLQEEALEKGYMSAPGVVHGLLTKPGDVLKSGWKRGGNMGKAFAGLGAYEAGKGLIEDPTPGGPGRLEKGLRGAGSAVGWMVAPTALLGGQLIGSGGASVGGSIGKAGDRLVGRLRRPRRAVPQGEY